LSRDTFFVVLDIAIVEDEKGIREAVSYALTQEGYEVTEYGDGEAALSGWERDLPGLIILDVLMPRVGGLDVCREVRRRDQRVPILFLTSRSDEIDKVLGLELGADDYLCKPFSMRELVARVHALERRASPAASAAGVADRIESGPLELDRSAFRCRWNGARVDLTVTEFRILETIALRPGDVVSRDQLFAAAYPRDVYVTDRSIDSHIRRIRRKFLAADPGFSAISTVYGAGYSFLREPE
jgi:DNA-binding response OmpR family regulator